MNILITGGASGLGEAITTNLAENISNNIWFTYCNSSEKAKELEEKYANCKGMKCDFDSEISIDELQQKIESLELEVLINNALTGIQTNYFHKTDPNYFLDSFQKNVLPVVKITQALILKFRKQRLGKIITVLSSYIINKPPIGLSKYVAEKNYLLSLSKSWATENAKFNITSNCVSPSMLKTNLTSETDERIIEEMENQHPLKKLLSTQEVAQTIGFLLNATQHINGTNIALNAGSDLS